MVRCKQSWHEPGRLPDLGKLQEHVYHSRNRRVGTFPPGVCWWNDQVVAYTSSSLHSSTQRTFWTQTLVVFDICTLYRHTVRQSYVFADTCSGHLFWRDFTKPAITTASVDRFYLHLVICLQLEVALLFQNSVKIWHCLPELWQCIQGFTFSWTQCIYNM